MKSPGIALLAALAASAAPSPALAEETPIFGGYAGLPPIYVVEVTPRSGGIVEVVTRMDSRSEGTSFTRNRYDCRTSQGFHVNQARTLAEVRRPAARQFPEWYPLSPGSGQSNAAAVACSRLQDRR